MTYVQLFAICYPIFFIRIIFNICFHRLHLFYLLWNAPNTTVNICLYLHPFRSDPNLTIRVYYIRYKELKVSSVAISWSNSGLDLLCMMLVGHLLLLLRMSTLSVVIEMRMKRVIMAMRMMVWMLVWMQWLQLIMLLLLMLLVLTMRWSGNSRRWCLRWGRTHRLWNERTCGLDWLTAKLYLLLLLLLQLLILMLLLMLQLALAIVMLAAAAGNR